MANKRPVEKVDYNGIVVDTYESISEASFLNDLEPTSIHNVCAGKKNHKTAGGFVWRYKKGED